MDHLLTQVQLLNKHMQSEPKLNVDREQVWRAPDHIHATNQGTNLIEQLIKLS